MKANAVTLAIAAGQTHERNVGGGALDAPCSIAYIVSLRPGDRQKSTVYRRGVEDAAPYGVCPGVHA